MEFKHEALFCKGYDPLSAVFMSCRIDPMKWSSLNSGRRPPGPLRGPWWILPIVIMGLAVVLCDARAIALQAAPARVTATPGGVAQDASDIDENEVPPADVEKYVAVYKAMQRDRSLTAETAAAHNGMTLEAFRQLEARMQRDDAALQRARDELQAAAKKAAPAGSP
jgi:hypothetical protein